MSSLIKKNLIAPTFQLKLLGHVSELFGEL